MENKKKLTIVALVESIAAVFMWIAVKKIAPVCTGMLELTSGKQVHMKCHYASVVLVFIAILLLVNAIIAVVTKPSIVSAVMTVVIAAFIFITLNDSVGIGICANPDMACQMTAPFAKVCGTIEIICGLVYGYMVSKKEK